MISKLLVAFLFLLAIYKEGYTQKLSGDQKKIVGRIDSYLKEEFPGNEPGAVVLIAQNAKILYRNAFGLADMAANRKIEEGMVFQIASMTKQFTAVSILQLAEKNKLSLKDTIQQYIPEFPVKRYPITIEQLLSQTAGVPEYFDIDENEYHLLTREHTPEQVIDYFKDRPLEFEPGTKFRYSNSNYFLLGLIIERASGKTYGDYLEENIFTPAGMSNSSYWYKPGSIAENIPKGYMKTQGNYTLSTPVGRSVLFSSGGLVSTIDDLLYWNSALATDKLLNEKSRERLVYHNKLSDGRYSGYAFGFSVKDLQGSPTIQHGGNLYGFTSSGLFLPKENIYIAILSNTGFKSTEEMANYLGSELIGKPLAPPKRVVLSTEELKLYTGTYELVNGGSRKMNISFMIDRLVLSFPEQPGAEVDILPVKKDHFISKKVNAKLTFTRDEEKVTGLTVDQKGITNWKKISD